MQEVPFPEWDDPLQSDVALKLQSFGSEPTILLRKWSELSAGNASAPKNQIIFATVSKERTNILVRAGRP
jgi:hypothetical protein